MVASRQQRSIPLRKLAKHADVDRDELDDLDEEPSALDAPLLPGDNSAERANGDPTSKASATSDAVRRIALNAAQEVKYPSNTLSNAKYNVATFVPLTLFEQFKYFFNLYFLLVALSQLIPALRIGLLATYIVPLAFVLFVTMMQEAFDEIARRARDKEANSELFDVLGRTGLTAAKDIKVGDMLRLYKDRRIPADVILLRTGESDGETFIRTDQLDGETDWKLRTACQATQALSDDEEILRMRGSLSAGPPIRSVNEFSGSLRLTGERAIEIPLTIDNALWTNTVLASGSSVVAVVVYTGTETRQALNTSQARLKVGLLELEINSLSKILCALTLFLSLLLVAFHGFGQNWYIDVLRFLILFSTIVPISLRVNLDLGKNVYARQIELDDSIPETVVRTSTIPEDLGRIEYLLTDKTGTLTKNDMEMKKLHVGTVSYAGEAMQDVRAFVLAGAPAPAVNGDVKQSPAPQRTRREISSRVRDLVSALAVCHNVTPSRSFDADEILYQAASPDELAIVKWTATVGLSLIGRDRQSLKLQRGANDFVDYDILHTFPFTSETKRMGIVVHERRAGQQCLVFYQKGADSVMSSIVAPSDWLEEEIGNMAREGLRTLVVGRKLLSEGSYRTFLKEYEAASLTMTDRDANMLKVVSAHLEHNLELLGLTGVEDKLQDEVKKALEFLRNAGIKVWMLTGDKVETARCIAISAKLVSRGQYIRTITRLEDYRTAMSELEFLQSKPDAALLIDGQSLQFLLDNAKLAFIETTTRLPAVICCRCSPTQKADVALLIRSATRKRVCCIGDGGNDVSMIQAADVGIGIVGKEGRQASLAADFSVLQFKYLMKLLVWHGRNSYKRSAKLAQFVIHRGLIIAICQIVFSITSSFAPIALYQGYLMAGYATIWTMMPLFSLVLDRDLDEPLALLYPELYKELTEGRSLSYRTFFIWVGVSVYQGVAIMLTTLLLNRKHDEKMVAISFTALIINELFMVALEINTWHRYMIVAEVASAALYVACIPFLGDYFGKHSAHSLEVSTTTDYDTDLEYILSASFVWRTAIVAAISLGPIYAVRVLHRRIKPAAYRKVAGNV